MISTLFTGVGTASTLIVIDFFKNEYLQILCLNSSDVY
jgi:hypothetical protein